MTRKIINQSYARWLQELVSGDERLGRRYSKLLTTLGSKEFKYFVPNDDNRASDGKQLRIAFLNATLKSHRSREIAYVEVLQEPCSILEMLIGLSIRFEELLIDGDSENRTNEWFWEFIHNLRLGTCTDDRFNSEMVDAILKSLLDRTYARNGKGGVFPLRHSKEDQRQVELWYQMMAYLDENYEI